MGVTTLPSYFVPPTHTIKWLVVVQELEASFVEELDLGDDELPERYAAAKRLAAGGDAGSIALKP